MSVLRPTPGASPATLPELTFELAREVGNFPEFAIRYSDADVKLYRRTTGDDNGGADGTLPPAFAVIFGRQAYLRHHRMPGGAVLLGQDVQWLHPARLDEDLLVSARVIEAHERDDGRRILVLLTTARQGGRDVARVRIRAGWPR
jgi:hypothetical protein